MFLGFKSIIVSLYQGWRMFVHSRAKENILHDHKLKDKFSQSKNNKSKLREKFLLRVKKYD